METWHATLQVKVIQNVETHQKNSMERITFHYIGMYPLTLIRCWKGNWLHEGSIPSIPTLILEIIVNGETGKLISSHVWVRVPLSRQTWMGCFRGRKVWTVNPVSQDHRGFESHPVLNIQMKLNGEQRAVNS
jgi:hypothetical protein